MNKRLCSSVILVIIASMSLTVFPAPASAAEVYYPTYWYGERPVSNSYQYDYLMGNGQPGEWGGVGLGAHVFNCIAEPGYATTTVRFSIDVGVNDILRAYDWAGPNGCYYVKYVKLEFFKLLSSGPSYQGIWVHQPLGGYNLKLLTTYGDFSDTAELAAKTAFEIFAEFVPGASLGITFAEIGGFLANAAMGSVSRLTSDQYDSNSALVVWTNPGLTDYANPNDLSSDYDIKEASAYCDITWNTYDEAPAPWMMQVTATAGYGWYYLGAPVQWGVRESSTSIILQLRPDTTAPSISSPEDVSYPVNSIAPHSITWQVSDVSPASYSIEKLTVSTGAREIVSSGVWGNTVSSLTQSLAGLQEGTYVYTCTVFDALARSSSDPVIVTVTVASPMAETIPGGHSYNFKQISTPYGTGYRVDTSGFSDDYNFYFLGFLGGPSAAYVVGSDGAIEVRGYFRQDDTFDSYLAPGRRVTSLYVMYSSDLSTIVKRVDILDYTDGTYWKYRDAVISGLNPYSVVTIGVGRFDAWGNDWSLAAEWAAVQVSTVTLGWAGTTSPTGHYMRSWAISTAYGPGWHVDTQGSGDYGYNFYAYTSPTFKVGADGKVQMQGWFRQYDTFYFGLEMGRRVEYAYVVDVNNPSTIIQGTLVSTYIDGTGWVFKTVTIIGLPVGSTVRAAIGRQDYWGGDWSLTSEWAGISIITSGISS